EPASPVRDVSEGEACPTESGFITDQDRATIAKSFTLPHDLAPRVISPAADEGSMQHTIFELTALCTSLQSEVGPTASPIVTSYSRRKAKEVMVESDTPKKQILQEHIDAQVSRDLEEQQEREDIRMNEQIARDAEVAMIHAEEELQGMIDRVTKQVKDFIPMGSKEEAERLKRKGLNLEQEHVKEKKSSEQAPEMEKSTEEITEEKIKEMMQLVPIEDVYVQALQVKHPIIDWNVHIEGQRSYWKIIKLGG
nr:hypothetical protein [Tanacetum cinerariifolium]